MSESRAKVFTDFEFHFLNGSKDYATIQEGKGAFTHDDGDGHIRLEVQHDDGPLEHICIIKSALAQWKTVRREVQPEVTTTDAGRTRIVGSTHG